MSIIMFEDYKITFPFPARALASISRAVYTIFTPIFRTLLLLASDLRYIYILKLNNLISKSKVVMSIDQIFAN